MSSLINNAMSGLNAAQAALNTASNNISSYNVAGYTRQTTIMAQANSTLGAGGWVGTGGEVDVCDSVGTWIMIACCNSCSCAASDDAFTGCVVIRSV